jgi:hypothetical protein
LATRPRFEAEAEEVKADSSVLRADERGALRIRCPSRPGICSQDRDQGSKPRGYEDVDIIAGDGLERLQLLQVCTATSSACPSLLFAPLLLPGACVRFVFALRRSFHNHGWLRGQPGHSVKTENSVRFFQKFGFQQSRADRFGSKLETDRFCFGLLLRFFGFNRTDRNPYPA